MTPNEALKKICHEIKLSSDEEFYTSVENIAKKLNAEYYELDSDTSSHLYVVGSVGRKTAIKGASDIDIIFDLPTSLYSRFNSYDGNGQSALLQEIKNTLKDRYPRTDIKGDGQVVSVEFDNYTVELVPAFKQSDNSFKYPDSNNGGQWKITNPLAEQSECRKTNNDYSNFYNLCRLIRKWKNNIGFEFKGLLVDTLTNNYLIEKKPSSSLVIDNFREFLEYISKEDKEQTFWYALGSNQKINNDDSTFISKAKKAYEKISKCKNDDELHDALRSLLGKGYPKEELATWKEKQLLRLKSYDDTEEYIEDQVPVDIRYKLTIDCEVKQNGFRDFLLLTFLQTGNPLLKIKKNLDFFISSTNCPEPYHVYWKVKNVGKEAIERNEIRGQIIKSNERRHHENTKFWGPHYVECYLIKDGVCVAKDKIDVPIGYEE